VKPRGLFLGSLLASPTRLGRGFAVLITAWTARVGALPQVPWPGAPNPRAPNGLAPNDASVPAGVPTGPSAPDIVQTIEPRAAVDLGAQRAPSDSGVRIDAGGWAKERFDLFPRELDTPTAGRSDLDFRTDLFARARYARGRSIEVTLSGSVSHTVFHGPPDTYRGAFDPMLREAYVGLFASNFDFRFGQQRLSWGSTDFLSPNDVLNARDLRDPFLGENELRFIPTPMIRADWYVGIVTFQAVFQPWFVPDRYDVYGTNWAGIQPDAPQNFQTFGAGAITRYDPTIFNQAQQLYQQTSLPRADFSQPSAGAQMAINGDGFDLHFYYQYGYDGPYVTIGDPTDASTLSATYVRRHHVGMSATASLGPIVARIEGAYQTQRTFFRADTLTSHKSPAVETAAALEWQTGDPTKVALLELYYQHIVDKPDAALLAWEQDSFGAGFSFRWPIVGVLRTDSRILASAAPQTIVAKPELELNFDEWIFGVGYLGVTGTTPSFGWYYRRNSEAFAFVKCIF
jgi:hypothetical protein